MARAKQQGPQAVTKDTLDDIEESIELLKVAYERYFNGVDRVPPRREHDKVKRSVRQLERVRIGSTALRFRAQGLRARLITYEQYWRRILNQIEKGTFKRVLAESARREYLAAQRKRELAEEAARQAAASEAEEGEASESTTDGKVRKRAVRKPATRPRRAALPDGMDAGKARDLFKNFIAAKKAAGEPTKGLTYQKLVSKLSREVPKLREKHGNNIRFEVATVKGKVRLRARRDS